MFYSLSLSEDCPVSDPQRLMWDYSLPEISKLTEIVEMREAIREAMEKDDKLTQASKGK